MTALPAFCTNCQSIFPFHGIRIDAGTFANFGTVYMPCPVCGYPKAELTRGVWHAAQGVVEILAAPDSTRAMAAALKMVAERLRAGEITKEQALEEARAISPRAAALLNIVIPLSLTAISVLIAAIALYLQWEGDKSSGEMSKKILDQLTEQTFTLKDMANEQRIQSERSAPSSEEPKSKPPTLKDPSKRRSKIKKEHRAKAKKQRADFGGARSH